MLRQFFAAAVGLVLAASCSRGPRQAAASSSAGQVSSDRNLRPSSGQHDWTRFGWDAGRSGVSTDPTGIDASTVGSLRRQVVEIDGTVDASPIYLHQVDVAGATRDVFFVTTSYGKTLALDAANGAVLWRFTPPEYTALAGTYRITNASPVSDPDRRFIYAAAPDGYVRKLAVSDGHVVWSRAVTALPVREKIASPLNVDRGHVIAVTSGYIGDADPYQGHVAAINAGTGRMVGVWNSLCSDRAGLLVPASCPQSGSGIWSRAGAVVDTTTGSIFVTTGNGYWNGRTGFGDAVVELDSNATTLLGNYTPANTEQLNDGDVDLGSTAPALVGGSLVVQGGKDAKLRLLDWRTMRGLAPHRGGERQMVGTPSGGRLFTAPAVMRGATTTWVFAADNGGTSAWTVVDGQLRPAWRNAFGGTSPVAAGGLLFVYDPDGGLRVYVPETGRLITTLPSGRGHWNSPIVVDGIVALPEGNANSHGTTGVLDLFRLP